jgi:hypothetical protein
MWPGATFRFRFVNRTALALGLLLFGLFVGCRRSKPVEKTPVARAPTAPAATTALPADVVECVDTNVAAGFANEDDIVEICIDATETDAAPDPQPLVALVAAALEKHKSRELGWRSPTDCDLLDAAFAAMEREGIVARQNFSDCQSCGLAEIDEEAEALAKTGKRVKGYAFYHQQDTEAAVAGGGLYLSYGALGTDRRAANVEIGRRVLRILSDVGLHASWNGNIGTRIGIDRLRWQRRRFTPAPQVQRAQAADPPARQR